MRGQKEWRVVLAALTIFLEQSTVRAINMQVGNYHVSKVRPCLASKNSRFGASMKRPRTPVVCGSIAISLEDVPRDGVLGVGFDFGTR